MDITTKKLMTMGGIPIERLGVIDSISSIPVFRFTIRHRHALNVIFSATGNTDNLEMVSQLESGLISVPRCTTCFQKEKKKKRKKEKKEKKE